MNEMNVFLEEYNPKRDRNVALSEAWGAAVGHNLLYSKDIGYFHPKREEIRRVWAQKVEKISAKPLTSTEYEFSFVSLKDEMNGEFGKYLSAEGFRISHAQKSLSVYMKHLWCMGVINEPPQCPVDKFILVEISKNEKYRDFKNIAWTKINDIAVHRSIIDAIREISGTKSIARWELEAFPGAKNAMKE